MISKKYIDDYKVDLTLTNNGKWKDVAIYIGPSYQLNLMGKGRAVIIKQQILLNVIGWCLFFLPLLVYSTVTRTIYIILPYMFLFLVLFYQSTAVYRLSMLKCPCRREEKDKVEERMKGSSLSGMILSCISVVCSIIYIITINKNSNRGDLLFACSDMMLMITFILHYRLTMKIIFTEHRPQE